MLWALSLRSSTGLQTTAKPNTELCWARGEPGDQKSKQDRTITELLYHVKSQKEWVAPGPAESWETRRCEPRRSVNASQSNVRMFLFQQCENTTHHNIVLCTALFFSGSSFLQTGPRGEAKTVSWPWLLHHGYCIRWFLRHSSTTSWAPRAACEVDWSKTLTSVGKVKELGAMLAWGNSTAGVLQRSRKLKPQNNNAETVRVVSCCFHVFSESKCRKCRTVAGAGRMWLLLGCCCHWCIRDACGDDLEKGDWCTFVQSGPPSQHQALRANRD